MSRILKRHVRAKGATRMRVLARRNVGRARGNQLTAPVAALRAEINNPIRAFHNIEMVFDDQDGVAGLHQPLQAIQQALNIREMQARRGLVENVKVMTAASQFPQLGGEFDALRLPAGEDGGRVAQLQVTKAERVPASPACGRLRVDRRRSPRFLIDISSTSAMLRPRHATCEGFLAVAAPLACRAGHFDVRHERQLREIGAVAGAFLAAPAFHIEAEGGRPEASRFGLSVSAKSCRIES